MLGLVVGCDGFVGFGWWSCLWVVWCFYLLFEWLIGFCLLGWFGV